MGKEAGFALLALGLGAFMLAQDLAALNVALPSIERDLEIDLTTAQWVVNAYLLVYGMLIVTGGRLADELGRRRVILAGAAIFAGTSLLAGLAPSATWLIGARALMGIGGGLMLPPVLGLAYVIVPPQRAELAGGLIVGAYATGMALGPVIGGALTEYLGWRWIQYLNVPLAALAAFGVWKAVPRDVVGARPPIDYAGIVTLSAGLVALLFALDQAADWGWRDDRIFLSVGIAVLFLLAFLWRERRAGATALIPGDVVRTPGIPLACALRVLVGPAYAAALLYGPQLMQKLAGHSPLQSGLGMLPMLGGYAAVSFFAGSLARRVSASLQIIVGLAALAIGPFLISRFDPDSPYSALAVGLLVTGIGLGLFFPASTTEAVKADDRDRKGLVVGLILMFQFVGSALGIGLTTMIVASAERSAVDVHLSSAGVALSAAEREALTKLLAGAESVQQVLRQFGPAEAGQLVATARDAFAAGVSAGLRLDAGLVAIGLVLAVVGLGRMRRTAAPAHNRSAAASSQ
jgi:EmrB/QacA subfamily drug resistance transporter